MLHDLPLLLAAAETTGGAGGIGDLPGTFGLDLRVIAAQSLNFLIVIGLLWYFAFRPVMDKMEEREATISQGLSDAEKAKQQLEAAEQEKAATLKEANASAQKILHEARTQSEEYVARQKEVFEGELSEKRRRAEEAIALERQKVLNEARADLARLVVLTSGKVLQKELSDEERGRLNAAATREMTAVS
jgi:F-type H+-transporting ATPase subunit b